MTSATWRRVAAVVLLLLAGTVYAPDASAQSGPGNYPSRPEAYSACMAWTGAQSWAQGSWAPFCRDLGAGGDGAASWTGGRYQACAYKTTNSPSCASSGFDYFYYPAGVCPSNESWDKDTNSCIDTRCEVARDFGIVTSGNLDQVMCLLNEEDGGKCEVAGLVSPTDGFVHLYATGDTCEPESYTCPSGYYKDVNGACTKKVECPEGVPLDLETNTCVQPEVCPEGMEKGPQGVCKPKDNSNCPAGHVKGPDGLCIGNPDMCPSGTVGTASGGCATDANDDGVPDDENEFIDSASCDSPPICHGDDIMCGQAMQLWRIDCNTRRHANVQLDAYCKQPPVCERIVTFDQNRGSGCTQQEEASMFLQWSLLCETRKTNELLAEQDGGDSNGDANNNGQPDWTEDVGDGTDNVNLGDDDTDGTLRALVVAEGAVIGGDGLDNSGLGFVRTCPTIPPLEINGHVIAIDTTIFCEWMQLGGQFVLLLAALSSLTLLATGVRS